ncbi:MAG: PrgI family protein [Candidatus Nanosyncoccaceae bacterium]|jgi:hypothetical protein
MSSYKVPQDVEAEDKLLGPFSFRQFIYLLISAGCGALVFFLGKAFPPFIILFAPVSIFFLVLSLPLRKDQPMEIYLAAVLQFMLRPRKKIWQSDGISRIVEFTNVIEEKDSISLKVLSEEQAIERISFLSDVVDSGGWAIRGVNNTNLQDSVIAATEEARDIHEDDEILENFDRMLNDSNSKYRSDVLNDLKTIPRAQPQKPYESLQPYSYSQTQTNQSWNQPNQPTAIPTQQPITTTTQPPIAPVENRQTITPTPSLNQVSPDIMNLATNEDFSIQTISSEANRLERERGQAKDLLGGQNQLEVKLR